MFIGPGPGLKQLIYILRAVVLAQWVELLLPTTSICGYNRVNGSFICFKQYCKDESKEQKKAGKDKLLKKYSF